MNQAAPRFRRYASTMDKVERALTIAECAAATGTTPDTLRYYEKIGLLARSPRERNGHRRFGDAEVRFVTFLRRLHDTGMPIRHMQQYARLLRRGDSTFAERRALLQLHRDDIRRRMATLEEHLRMIEKKIRIYGAPRAEPEPRKKPAANVAGRATG
jgi:DNA-binding transcriptional MerR regulator